MSATPDGISVVVPVFNNANSLRELVERLERGLADTEHEIILVDDESYDGSRETIAQLAVVSVCHENNQGQSAAILSGLRRVRFNTVVVMDGDLQDLPEDVMHLCQHLQESQAEVVFSERRGKFKLSSLAFRASMKMLFPHMPFRSCLHWAMTGETCRSLVATANARDYLIAVVGVLGVPCVSLPLERGVRKHGATGYPGLRRVTHGCRLLVASVRRRMQGRESA